MAQISVWNVKFHVEASSGKVTSGPYSAFVGISGGTRGDQQTHSVALTLATAINNNLLNILKAMGNASLTAAPGGTVVVDDYAHGSIPDIWT